MNQKRIKSDLPYYFRIVDSCKVEAGRKNGTSSYNKDEKRGPFRVRTGGKFKIVNDSLYRFRMTGKASALFANIRFESGVLRANEIDPFGSTVALDEKTRTFHVTPATVNRRNARRHEIRKEIRQLKELLEELANAKHGYNNEQIKTIKSMLENMIVEQIKRLAVENDTAISTTPDSTSSNSNNRSSTKSEEGDCPDGRPFQQSYSLYGPEGVRRLDPDERLVMAMTSDSKPLIGMLQELTDRSLKAQQTPGTEFKDIAAERSRVSHAQHDIELLRKKEKLTESDIAGLIKKLEMRFKSQQ